MRKALIYLLALPLTLISCANGDKEFRSAGGAMWNTIYNIKYLGTQDLSDSVISEMRKVEQSLSPFKESSIISRINRGEDVKVDSMIRDVFNTSLMVNRASGGAFDPTVSPLVSLWGFGENGHYSTHPSQAQIDSALISVGINRCALVDEKIIKHSPATRFNFSAITKGYGCDKVAEMLQRNGCEDYMVEIGGEITLAGKNPNGKDWIIQIDAPIIDSIGASHERMATIQVTDCGIATSGNYRNYHIDENGNVYGHTISPTTGRPVETNTLSATIIAPSAMLADALATSCMAMTPSDALEMINFIDQCEALIVVANKDGHMELLLSDGFPKIQK